MKILNKLLLSILILSNISTVYAWKNTNNMYMVEHEWQQVKTPNDPRFRPIDVQEIYQPINKRQLLKYISIGTNTPGERLIRIELLIYDENGNKVIRTEELAQFKYIGSNNNIHINHIPPQYFIY